MTGVPLKSTHIEFGLHQIDQTGVLVDHDDVVVFAREAPGNALAYPASAAYDYLHQITLLNGSPMRLHPTPSIFYEGPSVPSR